jgi:hypothetical protein
MKTLSNIGCFLIGWNKNILKECGEASYRQFRKLLSAICIMMVLWGTIGYCFADSMRGAGFHVHCVMCGKGYYPDSGQGKDDEFHESAVGFMYGHIGFLYLRSDYLPQ